MRLRSLIVMAALSSASARAAGAAGAKKEWMDFELRGFHPFVGVGLMGGPTLPFVADAGKPGKVDGSFLFALRGGFFAGRNEFSLELSPMTYVVTTQAPGPSFQLAFNFTGYVPLLEGPKLDVFWPLRVGYGVVAANTYQNAAYMQLRIDILGAAFRIGHVMIDLALPGFRYLYSPSSPTGNGMFFSWMIGAQTSYIF